jgi:hypothetical protein
MKNLVCLFLAILALTMTTGTYAQSFVVKGGFNLSEMLYISDNNETYSDEFDMRRGYNIGATAEFPMTERFSFETGLLLTTKGFRMRDIIYLVESKSWSVSHLSGKVRVAVFDSLCCW